MKIEKSIHQLCIMLVVVIIMYKKKIDKCLIGTGYT